MFLLRFSFLLFLVLFDSACTHKVSIIDNPDEEVALKTVSYLALGDSYTIGHNVPASSSFPFLLKAKLEADGFSFSEVPKIIAKTGWTCDDLLSNIQNQTLKNNSFDLVTVLIGVNDQYRGFDIQFYPERFTKVLQKAIDFAGNKEKVIVLSIPDYSVTPFGGGSQNIAKSLAQYNTINKKISLDMGIKYVDITPISLKAKNDLTYLASDKLHPSEKMYAEWVNEMWDEVLQALQK